LWARDSLQINHWPLVKCGTPLAWAVFAAALLDAIENVGLLWQLIYGPVDSLARVAMLCAWIKFGIIFVALVYCFYAAVLHVTRRLVRPSAA
jgi:hypothetical protein